MNILVDKLPIDYEGLKIDTNFRSFILFELLMQDNKLSIEEKIYLALNLFYKEVPKDVKKGIEGILWFYSMGNNDKKSSKKEEKTTRNNIYSFEYDAKLIYSAFLGQYGINLNKIEYLHWFEFKSLFEGLNEENKICKYMQYRSIDLSKIKDKEEKKRYKKLKQLCALPDERTEEEKEKDFAEAFW